VVELSVFEQTQRSDGRKWIFSCQWFLVVVEVDNVGFPEA
jgi:hypothetical protein